MYGWIRCSRSIDLQEWKPLKLFRNDVERDGERAGGVLRGAGDGHGARPGRRGSDTGGRNSLAASREHPSACKEQEQGKRCAATAGPPCREGQKPDKRGIDDEQSREVGAARQVADKRPYRRERVDNSGGLKSDTEGSGDAG